ncbi:MAG: hypothetical protein ACRD0P_30190, partial [Stackebrandtia sp.]
PAVTDHEAHFEALCRSVNVALGRTMAAVAAVQHRRRNLIKRRRANREVAYLPDMVRYANAAHESLGFARAIAMAYQADPDTPDVDAGPVPRLPHIPRATVRHAHPTRRLVADRIAAALGAIGEVVDLMSDPVAVTDWPYPDRDMSWELHDPVNAAFGALSLVEYSFRRATYQPTPRLDYFDYCMHVAGLVAVMRPRVPEQYREGFGFAMSGGEYSMTLKDVTHWFIDEGHPVTVVERDALARLLRYGNRPPCAPSTIHRVTVVPPEQVSFAHAWS